MRWPGQRAGGRRAWAAERDGGRIDSAVVSMMGEDRLSDLCHLMCDDEVRAVQALQAAGVRCVCQQTLPVAREAAREWPELGSKLGT